jgi:hypothetical protein
MTGLPLDMCSAHAGIGDYARDTTLDNPFVFRDTLLVMPHDDPLMYRELVGRGEAAKQVA